MRSSNDWSGAAASMVESIRLMLNKLDVSDEVRDHTPDRVAEAWGEMLEGYEQDDDVAVLGRVYDDVEYDEIVLVRDIEFASVCEHHMLPFQGVAHVGYLPEGNRIIGLSKIPRLVNCYARRLQVQERLTQQIATALNDHVRAQGVAVVLRASHGCMGCRGIRQPGTTTVTSVMTGKFRESAPARAEVLALIGLA